MQEIKLSKRLLRIVNYIPKNKIVADIGSDHALLVSYLIKNNISLFAIAGEINDGPFQASIRQVRNYNLEGFISVRKGNGLEIINQEEVIDIVVIAGMGGILITNILNQGKNKLRNVERLILQPNVGEKEIRMWLDNNYWDIIDEDMIKEDGKIYEIIIAEPRHCKNDPIYDVKFNNLFPINKEDLYKVGPILYKKKPEVLIEKWNLELKKIENIFKQLEKSKKEKYKEEKMHEFQNEYQWVSEVVKCLQQGNILSKSSSN